MFFCKNGASCTLIYRLYIQSYTCTPTTLFSLHPQNKPYIPVNVYNTLSYTPNYHNLKFSTPTDTLHIHYKVTLASLHSKCMAMLSVNSWKLYLMFTPGSIVLCLSPLLTIPFISMAILLKSKFVLLIACLLWISCYAYAQDKIAYHLHPILCTWDAVTACTPVTLSFPLGVFMLEIFFF